MPDYIHSTTCTVQRRSGDFCDAPAGDDMPFPICEHHARQLMVHLMGRDSSRDLWSEFETKLQTWVHRNETVDPQADARAEQTQVYYVKIHDRIKIGYTCNVLHRMSSLRVPLGCVMATEPGGIAQESLRHKQFKHLRYGRREDFRPEPDLLEHIDSIVKEHGEPLITTWLGKPARRLSEYIKST